jgi:hypothetical protein
MKAYELTYLQRYQGASKTTVTEITAGFVESEAEAVAFKKAAKGNSYHEVNLDPEDAWMLSGY